MRPFDSLRAAMRVALLAALVLALPACDSGGDGPAPTTDTILFGVNYTRLFAPAADAETAAVRADWDARNTMQTGAEIVDSTAIDGARVVVVRHQVVSAGQAGVTHYAVVRIPPDLDGLAPLLVVHHGGDDGFNVGVGTPPDDQTANTSLVRWVAAFPALAAATIQVWPVYRSEELRTTGYADLGGPYTAGGTASPWDYDVDDAIASVQATVALFPDLVDTARRAAIGFSRGGNTAALHAIRDEEMDALVDYYGPTDFYNASAQLLATGVLSGSSSALNLPGAQFLFDNVLDPLRNADGTYNAGADYAGARLEVARRSASLFTSLLPDTQVHHHYRDGIVPYTFSAAFAAAAQTRGSGGSFDLFPYGTPPTSDADLDGSFHAPEANPESLVTVGTFLLTQLGLNPTLAPTPVAYAF